MKYAILSIALVAILTHAALGESRTSDVAVKVPFVIPLESADYQALLDQLGSITLSIDEAAIKRTLTARINSHANAPTDAAELETLVQTIYDEQILPVLEPRVERFNELMNQSVSRDKVSAGFIAFTGLAKGMARHSDKISGYRVHGSYTYPVDAFDTAGHWTLYDDIMISGTSHFHRHLSGAIDEAIDLDLQALGSDHSVTLHFSASGEVKISQTYGCKQINRSATSTTPTILLQFEPYATVTAERKIDNVWYFQVEHEDPQEVTRTFTSPVRHLLELKAEPVE